MIINAGIKKIIYMEGYPDELSQELLKEATVEVFKIWNVPIAAMKKIEFSIRVQTGMVLKSEEDENAQSAKEGYNKRNDWV